MILQRTPPIPTQQALMPLCVDLDDTLVVGDTFFKSICRLIFEQPGHIPELIRHFFRGGRAAMKAYLSEVAPIEAEKLVYRQDLLAYLKAEKQKGRKLYLISAAHQDTVNRVARHIGLFEAAYGSTADFNLK